MNDNFSETFNLYEKYSDLKLAFLRTKCIGSLGEKNYFMPTVLTFYYISLNRTHTERHILTYTCPNPSENHISIFHMV